MSVIRVEKTKDYTIMSNHHLKEKNMSLKSKGLLSLMLSLPDNWDYSIAGLISICKENETAIKSALDELRSFGYVEMIKKMPNTTESGRIEYEYIVREIPLVKQLPEQKQDIEKQEVENLGVENPLQLNIKQLNTNNNINNINIINKEEIEKKKKQAKKEKQIKDAITINKMLDNFTENKEVKDYLKKYLEIRKKKGLTPEQWKIILDDLRKECKTDKNYAIEEIKKAIAGGWLQIIYKTKTKFSYSSKPNFDNTSNHILPKAVSEMSDIEKKNFYENELAKDENGDFLKF